MEKGRYREKKLEGEGDGPYLKTHCCFCLHGPRKLFSCLLSRTKSVVINWLCLKQTSKNVLSLRKCAFLIVSKLNKEYRYRLSQEKQHYYHTLTSLTKDTFQLLACMMEIFEGENYNFRNEKSYNFRRSLCAQRFVPYPLTLTTLRFPLAAPPGAPGAPGAAPMGLGSDAFMPAFTVSMRTPDDIEGE